MKIVRIHLDMHVVTTTLSPHSPYGEERIMPIEPTYWSLRSEAFLKWLNKCHATDYILHNDYLHGDCHSDYLPASEDCKTRRPPQRDLRDRASYAVSRIGPLCYDTVSRVTAPTRAADPGDSATVNCTLLGERLMLQTVNPRKVV